MIDNAHGTAMVAAIDMAAEVGSAAIQQIIEDFSVFGPQAVLLLICVNMFSENIGQLQWAVFSFDDRGHQCCPPLMQVHCL
jgi:hypothetical protein